MAKQRRLEALRVREQLLQETEHAVKHALRFPVAKHAPST